MSTDPGSTPFRVRVIRAYKEGLTLGDHNFTEGKNSRLGKAMRGDSIRPRLRLLSLNKSAGPCHSLSLSIHLTPGK